MNITKHFTLEEMIFSATAKRLGLKNDLPDEFKDNVGIVATRLELVRQFFNKPIHITSCYRSPAVNAAVGGSPTSAHRYAMAVDFEVQDTPNIKVCQWCADNINDYDQIIYEFGPTGWCHMGFTHGKPRKELLTAIKEGSRTVYHKGLIP